MRLTDSLRVTWRYIRHRMLESFVVVLGIALGVGIISAVLGIYTNYLGSMRSMLDNPTWREISLQPRSDSLGGFSSIHRIDPETGASGPPMGFSFEDLAAAKEACPSVDYGYVAFWQDFSLGESDMPRPAASRFIRNEDGTVTAIEETPLMTDDDLPPDQPGSIPPNAQIEQFGGRAVTPEFFQAYGAVPAHGSLFTDGDVEDERAVIVLGDGLARQLYPEREPEAVVGNRIRLNGAAYTILGILEPAAADVQGEAAFADQAGFIPVTLSRPFVFGGQIHALTFSVTDPERLDVAVQQLTTFVDVQFGEAVEVVNRRADFLEQRRRVVPVLTVIGLLSSIGLFVAAINILNLMLARVVRRRKAIGISAALGGSRSAIFKQYLTESMGLGLLGGVLGIGLAAVLTKIIALMLTPQGPAGASGPALGLTLETVALALGITLVVNLVFAVYPAYKASAVDPAEALRA